MCYPKHVRVPFNPPNTPDRHHFTVKTTRHRASPRSHSSQSGLQTQKQIWLQKQTLNPQCPFPNIARETNQRRIGKAISFQEEKEQGFFNELLDETKSCLTSSYAWYQGSVLRILASLLTHGVTRNGTHYIHWISPISIRVVLQISLASFYGSLKKKKSVLKLIQSWLVYIKITNIFHGNLRQGFWPEWCWVSGEQRANCRSNYFALCGRPN